VVRPHYNLVAIFASCGIPEPIGHGNPVVRGLHNLVDRV
jgi:hypothetical protein